jgi:succinate dehydrogenase/fumarate reductase flavoprotein subunit
VKTNVRTVECDVAVLGGGGAGLAAAIEAAVAGARVVILEKADYLLGSTGRSVGAFAASGTRDQRRLSVADSPDRHFEDYRKMSGDLAVGESEELVRLLVECAADSLAWLQGLGVEFYGPVEGVGHSVARLHTALPSSRSYIYHLHRRARRLGVTVLLSTAAETLEQSGDGVNRVIGRSADGADVVVNVRRGVILAAGDFSASREMKRKFISDRVATFMSMNPGATGDAQRMAMDLGAQMLNANVFDVPSMRLAPPPAEGWFGLLQKLPPRRLLTLPIKWGLRYFPGRAIRPLMLSFVTTHLSPRETLFADGAQLVDRDGRWMPRREESVSLTVAELGERGGYIIGDRRLFDQYSCGEHYVAAAPGVARAYLADFRRSRKDLYTEASSLEDLAAAIGVPPAALRDSVEAGNSAATRGGTNPLIRPPFFALGPIASYLTQTNAGLRVSRRMEVLTEKGEPIPRLFAAGNAGQSGLVLRGHGHHLAWAFTSGRIAGRNAAAN